MVTIEQAVFALKGAAKGGERRAGEGAQPVEQLAIAGTGGEVGIRAMGGAWACP